MYMTVNEGEKRSKPLKVKKRGGFMWLLLMIILLAIGLVAVRWFIEDSKRIVVAIDPGHGGTDIGAEGIENEATINERTAKYLYELLKEDMAFKPVYTRKFKTDVKYTLADRIDKANRVKAQLLISIHGNSSSNKKGKGFECYAAPPGRKNHEASMKFARLIAEKMGDAGHLLRGEDGVRFMYYLETKKNGSTIDIRESSYTNTERTELSIAMVENPNCPSVLVEQCFVNNPADYDKWGSEEGSEKSARIYYEAICEYFGVE